MIHTGDSAARSSYCELIPVTKENNLVQLTAEIVESMVSGNRVNASELPELISSTYAALAGLGAPVPEPEAEKPKGAVSIKASIKPDGLISMIDGKKYQTLRRHITRHGYTPESYREAFGLPRDYPLTSASYSELRRGMAHKIGLGRKATAVEEPEPAPAPAPADEAPKRGRKAKAVVETPAPVEAAAEPKRGRGRPRKAAPAEAPDDFFDPAAK
jgi:predicted transcriptional regulator